MPRHLTVAAAMLLAPAMLLAEPSRAQLESSLVDALMEAAEMERKRSALEPGDERDAIEAAMKEGQAGMEPLLSKLGLDTGTDADLVDLVKRLRPGQEGPVVRLLRGDDVAQAMAGLKTIGVLLALYESVKKDLPKTLEEAYALKLLPQGPEDVRCPLCAADPVYIFPQAGDRAPMETVVAHCPKDHPDGSRCVLTMAGAAHRLTKARFSKAQDSGTVAGLILQAGPARTEIRQDGDTRVLVATVQILGLQVPEGGGATRLKVRGLFSGISGPSGDTGWLRMQGTEGTLDCVLELPLAADAAVPGDLDLVLYDEVAKQEERAYVFLGKGR